jgi:hypothetical protein
MFPVKSYQIFSYPIPRLYGLSSQPEAVAETPGFLVKIRAVPLKPLYRTITQYEEVAFTMSWHPAVVWW